MNKFFLQSSFGLFIFLIVFSSCCKEVVSSVEETADKVEGVYDLIRATWQGNPIDVNNDGIAGTELLPELMSLPTNAQNRFIVSMLPISMDRQYGCLGMQLPMQNVYAESDGVYPKGCMVGNTLYVSMAYQIDEKGSLSVEHFDSVDCPESEKRIEWKRIRNGTVNLGQQGEILFTVSYTLYDHKDNQLVDGIMKYTFKKKES